MCATCGCGMKGKMSSKKPMSKTADKKQDAKATKGMTPAQKKKFEAADKKMDKKKPSAKADVKMDKALAKKIKNK